MKRISLFLLFVVTGCDSSLKQIDNRVDQLMVERSESIGAVAPSSGFQIDTSFDEAIENTNPNTVNPTSEELVFVSAKEIDAMEIAEALQNAEANIALHSEPLTLKEALGWANTYAKEIEFARYDYVSTTLSLLHELHLWGPRFSNSIRTVVDADSTGGMYDTTVSVINDFQVSQNLYNGGTLSATALTSFLKSVQGSTTAGDSSGTDLGVSLEIPLLSGSGAVARESLIQAKRNLVYSARTYERYRRTFYRVITGDYLSLAVQKQSLHNAQMGVDSLQQLASRQAALYSSGRARLYDSADAENQALAAVASLSQSWERYRLALDRFKIRIGWPIESDIDIVPTTIGVSPPQVNVSDAVVQALLFRLDLQNKYNQLGDAKRDVANAINSLLPDATFTAGVETGSDTDKPVKFSGEDLDFIAGFSFSVPLDKETERILVRQKQIDLEKSKRSYRESKDTVAVEVRSALRSITVYQFTLDLQERNVDIAKLGLDSINADPDRVSVLDQTRAISDLQGAKDSRDSARRDLELSIVDYLLQAGQLRIHEDGTLKFPTG